MSENCDKTVHEAEALHSDPCFREDTITIIVSVLHYSSGEIAFWCLRSFASALIQVRHSDRFYDEGFKD